MWPAIRLKRVQFPPMTSRWTKLDGGRFYSLALLALAIVLCGRGAWACQICLPAGMHSAAEMVLEAESVVVAREDSGVSGFARGVRVLKGSSGEVASDFFFMGQPPRRLGDRGREIICAYRDGKWQWVGRVDGEFMMVVGEVLAREQGWRRNPPERVSFFSRFLGSGNEQVSAMAHLEVARAPYGQIRRISAALPVEELRSSLRNFRLSRWHPLYILLLAQVAEEEDRALIEEKVRAAVVGGNPLCLAAWATAWIELAEEPALQFLSSAFLEVPGRDFELVRQVLLALSVQGTEGLPGVRDRIVPGYRLAVKNYPEAIPVVVGDLLKWECWDLLPEVQEVLEAPPELLRREELIALQVYRSKAHKAFAAGEPGPGREAWPVGVVGAVVLLVIIPVTMGIWRARRRSRPRSRS